jgi:hypothetical protein
MDIPRHHSPSRRIYGSDLGSERRGSKSRISYNTSPPSLSSTRSMPIPNAPFTQDPPPLPPPRVIEGLKYGYDVGAIYANSGSNGQYQKPTLPPIKQGSSLHGGYIQSRLNTKPRSPDQAEDFHIGALARDRNPGSTTQLSSRPDVPMTDSHVSDGEYQTEISPSSATNQTYVYRLFVSAYRPLFSHLPLCLRQAERGDQPLRC